MPVNRKVELKNVKDVEEKSAFLLALHCAPLLKGIKGANMMTVSEIEVCPIRGMLKKTDISSRFFCTKKGSGILYLCREKRISEYLDREENRLFLEECGYTHTGLWSMLDQLEGRLVRYSAGQEEFPHEIGLFLEYPLIDVRGFLENSGKNFVLSGYWKVYGDVCRTAERFKQYDKERERTIMEVASGRAISEIVL